MNICIEYSLTAKEYKEFEYEDYRRGLRQKKSWMHRNVITSAWMVRLFLAATGLGLLGLLYTTKPSTIQIIIVSSIVVAVFVLMNLAQYWYDLQQIKHKLRVFTGVHLVLQDDKITHICEVYQSESSWKNFDYFAETAHLYVLYIDRQRALIIPKRAFASEADSHLFRGIAQNGIAKTQGFPVETPQTTYRIPAQAETPKFDIGADDTPLMKLEYKLTYTDQREFVRAHKRYGPQRKSERAVILDVLKKVGAYCFMIPATAGAVWMAYTTNSDKTIGWIGAILTGSLMTLPVPVIRIAHYFKLKKAYGNAPVVRVDVYSDGIVSQNESQRAKYCWQLFSHFVDSDHLFALYLIENNAILIPKRVFASEADMHLFRGIAQSGIVKAQGFPVDSVDTSRGMEKTVR